MTLDRALAVQASAHPDGVALILGTRAITFAELDRRSRAVSRALGTPTQADGERVGLVTWEAPTALECMVGVPAAGGIVAPISPRFTPAEMAVAAQIAQLTTVIVDDAIADELRPLLQSQCRVIPISDWHDRVATLSSMSDDAAHADSVPIDGLAWLLFTSGTTGRPRAAALSQRNLLAAVATNSLVRPLAVDDVYAYPFPHWHVAVYNVICRLVAGRPIVLHPRFDPEALIDDIERHRVTTMSVAATMLDSILTTVESGRRPVSALSSLREVYYGAAPMPVSVLRRAAALLDVDWWQGYGMTETSGNLVFLGPDDHRRGLDAEPSLLRATGRPAPGVEVRIIHDDGPDAVPGASGEVLLRAEQVMTGYWGDADASASAVDDDGWLHTGDVGFLDQTGLLTLVDRKKDIIITGGENVSAREVEEVLRLHSSVADVAVIGVPDKRWGENVCAVVVPRAETTIDPDELGRHARNHLAGFKVPRHVVSRESLPVNSTGKVVKAQLRSWLADEPERLGQRR